MRISDWSSDVCSPDLEGVAPEALAAHHRFQQAAVAAAFGTAMCQFQIDRQGRVQIGIGFRNKRYAVVALCCQCVEFDRSEERSVGKECVSLFSSRWAPYH